MKTTMPTLLAATAVTVSLLGACDASGTTTTTGGAQGCAAFEGETISLVVPFSPGGGYDSYARMIAPELASRLKAKVIVENRDGAGGLLAINSLVTAKPDGKRLAIMNAVGVGGAAVAESSSVRFGLDKLSYIGRVGASYHIFSTSAKSRFKSFDDVIAADRFRYGSTGPGAADFVNGQLLKAIFRLRADIVTGFEGSEENELAVTSGKVDGMTGDFDSRLPAIRNGDHRPLLLLGPERDPQLPGTPALMELQMTPQQRALAQAQVDLLSLGRPIVGPPGIPADRLSCLRTTLQSLLQDSAFADKAAKSGRPINFMSGADVDRLVRQVLSAPPEFRSIMKNAYAGER
ncbi:Bug family tripartite tricarboxylate transporter substrate binding protein [Actinomadura sp. SCN-SB]|uniref:Bug family tripartite tricarboxylate transporter substrate binding protein n=1 Tax=Actinomadura sp. SCN-SB TaxID=3373092 RepID=UPI003751CDB7